MNGAAEFKRDKSAAPDGRRINPRRNMIKKDLEALALQALSLQLTRTTNSLGLFAGPALGRLFVGTAEFHFTEDALALHLLFQDL